MWKCPICDLSNRFGSLESSAGTPRTSRGGERPMLELLNRKSSDVLSLGASSLAQQFVPRADGCFDFFPKGMRKSGYRVDSETRDRVMRLERGPDGLLWG